MTANIPVSDTRTKLVQLLSQNGVTGIRPIDPVKDRDIIAILKQAQQEVREHYHLPASFTFPETYIITEAKPDSLPGYLLINNAAILLPSPLLPKPIALIGKDLLQLVTPAELRAAMVHEYGHAILEHTRTPAKAESQECQADHMAINLGYEKEMLSLMRKANAKYTADTTIKNKVPVSEFELLRHRMKALQRAIGREEAGKSDTETLNDIAAPRITFNNQCKPTKIRD